MPGLDSDMVSVIIPAFNSEKYITECISSIKKNDFSHTAYEIIVVDNGSSDKTVSIAERLGVKVLILPSAKIAGLRNHGSRFAQGNILAFLDSDCTVLPSWIPNACMAFEDPGIGIGGSVHRVPAHASWVARAWAFHCKEEGPRTYVNYVPSGNMFIRKRVFDLVEGFNEALSVSEDTDLCRRVIRNGYKVLSDESIVAYHHGAPTSLLVFFRKELWHGQDVLRLFIIERFPREYVNVMALSLGFLMLIAGTIWALFFNYKTAVSFVILLLIIPNVLSVMTCIKKKDLAFYFPLCLLYFTYGLARALCIINIKGYAGTLLTKRGAGND